MALTLSSLKLVVCSGGARKIVANLKASAPYFSINGSGLIILPRDLDIFSPSSPKIIPWQNNFWKGSG